MLSHFIADVVAHDGVDGAVLLQLAQGAVNLIPQFCIAFLQADGILFHIKNVLDDLQIVIQFHELGCRLRINNHAVHLSILQSLYGICSCIENGSSGNPRSPLRLPGCRRWFRLHADLQVRKIFNRGDPSSESLLTAEESPEADVSEVPDAAGSLEPLDAASLLPQAAIDRVIAAVRARAVNFFKFFIVSPSS